MRAQIISDIASWDDAQEYCRDQGWTDGLPVIPPTVERVQAILADLGVDGEGVIERIGPSNASLTWDKLVANAVMAGCSGEHLPVVAAAVRALCEPEFNLDGIQGTTGPHTPLAIINGPARHELDVNSGTNCFGSGRRANAVIGRAIRFVMSNVGGGVPGVADMATMGHPGKYVFCIGENEEASPWESLAVERGFQQHDSVVSVFACDSPSAIVDNSSTDAESYLKTIAGSLTSVGSIHYYMFGRGQQIGLVLSPERAVELAHDGWSKHDVKEYVYEAVRIPKRSLIGRGMYGNRTWPDWVEALDDDGRVPIVLSPDHVVIIVAGGPGRLSAVLPTWQDSRIVSKAVRP